MATPVPVPPARGPWDPDRGAGRRPGGRASGSALAIVAIAATNSAPAGASAPCGARSFFPWSRPGICATEVEMNFVGVRLLVGDFPTTFRFWRDAMKLPVAYSDETMGYAYFTADGAGL